MQKLAETSSGYKPCIDNGQVSLLSNLLAVEKNYGVPYLNHRNNLTRTKIIWESVLVCNHSHMMKKLLPLIKLNSLPLLYNNVT